MVRGEDSWSDFECKRQNYKRTSRAASITSLDEIHGKKSRQTGKYANIKSETKALLLKYYPCPLSAIRDVSKCKRSSNKPHSK